MKTKQQLQQIFDAMQLQYGDPNLCAVYGAGEDVNPKVCLVFMNPTAKNIATKKDWKGIRCQWLGTKQVWKFLTDCGLFDEQMNSEIQAKKPKDWTPAFCENVYAEVKKQGVYITNLAKCTQETAKTLSNSTYNAYKDLLLEEIALVNPQIIVLFGNQVSSVVLGQPISVSACRKKAFLLPIHNQIYTCFSVYYPVGNGFFNAPKAVEDICFICKNNKK